MSEWPREVYVNGKIVPRGEATISVEDRGLQFGDGLYEFARAYGGIPFRMDGHMRRLMNGVAFLDLPITVAHIDKIQRTTTELLNRSGLRDALIAIFVTRGAGPRGHAPPEGLQPTIIVYVLPATRPTAETVRDGIAAITVSDARWHHVNVKSLGLQPNVLAKRRALQSGASEAIFVRDGHVADSTASNVFIVRHGEVRTPPQGPDILPGITREVALELCRDTQIPFSEVTVLDTDLIASDEVFITGTSDEITPIVKIDGRVIGDGRPGPVTRRLIEAFRVATRG